MKVAFYTLGCKVNQYESQAMEEDLRSKGVEIVSHSDFADVYVVNSCTVTSESDKKTRQAVRRFKKNNRESCVVLTGCMSQVNPEIFEKLPEADIIIGNSNNSVLYERIMDYFDSKERIKDVGTHCSGEVFSGSPITSFNERERAFVKIQDGCNRFCSYCIIPYARGRVRSKPLEDIKKELNSLVANGYKEVVLTGINLSSYGQDNGLKFSDAIKVACETENLERVRLGSLEPDFIDDELLDSISKYDNFCPQFHLALQSGCDKTLKNMNRHYTCEEFEELCNKIRNKFDDATITTDIMAGFPNETDDDFEESVKFAEKIGFEKVHVFPYSVREGTRATKMEQIEKSEKEKRAKIMIERTNKVRQDFLKKQIGKTVEILIESTEKDGMNFGYTKNYTPVAIVCDSSYYGTIQKVLITDSKDDYCIGKIIQV